MLEEYLSLFTYCTMPQDCHGHAHDHGPSENDLGPQDSLYAHIDRQNVLALNVPGEYPSSSIIKPWHQRGDDSVVGLINTPSTQALKIDVGQSTSSPR